MAGTSPAMTAIYGFHRKQRNKPLVGLPHPDKPSNNAKMFFSALKQSGFSPRFTDWNIKTVPSNLYNFDLFVGPPR
jgi:hypothetical protein